VSFGHRAPAKGMLLVNAAHLPTIGDKHVDPARAIGKEPIQRSNLNRDERRFCKVSYAGLDLSQLAHHVLSLASGSPEWVTSTTTAWKGPKRSAACGRS
jgi:hypothetical protein